MYALDGERMLTAWERGREQREPWRALALLQVALPEWDIGALAALPLVERNALLLRLRAMTFGGRIEGFAVCPECGEQLQFVVNVADLERELRAPCEESWLDVYKRQPLTISAVNTALGGGTAVANADCSLTLTLPNGPVTPPTIKVIGNGITIAQTVSGLASQLQQALNNWLMVNVPGASVTCVAVSYTHL